MEHKSRLLNLDFERRMWNTDLVWQHQRDYQEFLKALMTSDLVSWKFIVWIKKGISDNWWDIIWFRTFWTKKGQTSPFDSYSHHYIYNSQVANNIRTYLMGFLLASSVVASVLPSEQPNTRNRLLESQKTLHYIISRSCHVLFKMIKTITEIYKMYL